ncbi:MAG: hypothetical protein ACP5GZ_05165 [Vulcanisaeta sp.]|jgi:hypothetical protein|uniref:hypothetical protein n=1 Tax=Vulcanisaeta sp. TaxID=2020871 RepID=UPI003D105EEE
MYGVNPTQLSYDLASIGVNEFSLVNGLNSSIVVGPFLWTLIGLTITVPINNTNRVTWFVTLVNVSGIFNIPTFGFVVNVSGYYDHALSCKS